MNVLKVLSRILIGSVFIFSGFVKAIDPLGSAYKFADYFSAFHLDFLKFTALPLSILLSGMELVLGIVLLLGYRRKAMYWVLMVFMSFFTFLTLLLAVFNPVSDCGCFGDALILTNWQTFLKNLVLMVFVLILFSQRNKEKSRAFLTEWSLIILLYAGSLVFSFWNFRHLPLLDFRPFSVGTVIAEDMEVPEGAPVDEYETSLVYRNLENGAEEEFSLENYPSDTSRWEFVSSESKLVKIGFEAPIHDFALMDEYGNDLVDKILTDPAYTLLMICHNLSEADPGSLSMAGDWSQLEILSDNFSFYAVTASTSDVVEEISADLDLGYSFLAADEIMLKTIVRSAPGFMLISNGCIIGKWAYRDFPALDALSQEAAELLGNAAVPMDEEAQILMEAGLYKDFSFSVLDFSSLLPELVYKPFTSRREAGVILAFMLSVLLLILLANQLKKIEK